MEPRSWSDEVFAPRCVDCSAGSYADGVTPAVNDCYPCFPGQEAPNNGSGTCTPCPAGSFSTTFNAVECDACPIGGFCASAGQGDAALAFTSCPGGSYNLQVGKVSASQCLPCPAGY